MTSPTGPRLHCAFLKDDPSKQVNGNVLSLETETNTATLSQVVGKKSSFLLPDSPHNDHYAIPTPAHIILEYRVDGKPQIFYLGGFQLVSNARHCEVYLSDQEGKETYLMTSKGISFDGDYNKAVSVVPGGPRAITRLHVKLLSLRPMEGDTTARLQSFKVTARCPESSASSSGEKTTTTTTTNGNKTTTTAAPSIPTSTYISPPPLTQSDLGAAMASMSIMARSTENRIEQALQDRFASMDQNLGVRWTKMEHHILQLTSVVVSQKQVMLEQNGLVVKQQHKLVDQGNMINELMVQQTELLQLTQTLQKNFETMQKDYARDQKESRERRERGSFATVKSLHSDLEELRQQQQMEREMKELELAEQELENVKSQEYNDEDFAVVEEAEVEATTEVTEDDDQGAVADAATEVDFLSFDDEDTPPQQDGEPSSDSGPAMDSRDEQSLERKDSKGEEKKDSDTVMELSEVNNLGKSASIDGPENSQAKRESVKGTKWKERLAKKKSEPKPPIEEKPSPNDNDDEPVEGRVLRVQDSEDAPEGDLLGLEGDLLELRVGQDDQPSE